MKGRKIHSCTYLGAVILMPLYLFIVAVHLFFIPQFQDGQNVRRSSFVKKETRSIYYLIRNDRSTYSENKHVKVTPKAHSFDSVAALAFSNLQPKNGKSNPYPYHFLPVHHHVWLSKHVLRI